MIPVGIATSNSHKCYDYRHAFAQQRDRVNVSIPHGKDCRYRPPYAAEGVAEHSRLCGMLSAVHTQAARHHQYKYDEHGRYDLSALSQQDYLDDIEAVVL